MTEKNDNTRVQIPLTSNKPKEKYRKPAPKQDQLWDRDKVKFYQNMQHFVNGNIWRSGPPINYSPYTQQEAIQASFNNTKDNVKTFAETLATTGAGHAIKFARTPVEIGRGAEAIITSAPISSTVTKATTIPRKEALIRNMVPRSLELYFKKAKDGLMYYTQAKATPIKANELDKAVAQFRKIMPTKGWGEIKHPNLQGVAFTNGKYVVSDLSADNIGRIGDKYYILDSVVERPIDFLAAMQKKGGKLGKKQFKNNILDSNPNLDNMKNNYVTKKKK